MRWIKGKEPKEVSWWKSTERTMVKVKIHPFRIQKTQSTILHYYMAAIAFGVVLFVIHVEQMAEWRWCLGGIPPATPTEMPLLDVVEFQCHGWQGLRNGSSQGATPNRSHGAT